MQRGFSLIELLLSIALIGILAGLSVPVYSGYVTRNDTQIAATTLTQAYRHAQQLARAGYRDTAWGVHVANGAITVFSGPSYVARLTGWDEISTISTAIGVSGATDIVFAKLTGLPNTTTTVTLSSTVGGTKTITLNETGMVQQ
jgi:type IV pilus assembly protein PilE